MRLTLAYFLLVAVGVWSPHGLIHYGQRLANPRAESIIGQMLSRCDPATAEWRGCKRPATTLLPWQRQ